MRNFKTVIRERYNQQMYDSSSLLNNIYAPVNSIGFYGELKAHQILFEFVNMLRYYKKDLRNIRICYSI